MNIKAVEERVLHAEGTAADVAGNMQEAAYLIDKERLSECIQRLEWAKENVRMLPYRIDEAIAAARKAAEGAEL